MAPVSAFVLYNCFWWITFFAILPMDYTRQKNPYPGCDQGAPEKAYIGRKVIRTTIIATVLWGVAVAIIVSGIFDLESFPYFNHIISK